MIKELCACAFFKQFYLKILLNKFIFAQINLQNIDIGNANLIFFFGKLQLSIDFYIFEYMHAVSTKSSAIALFIDLLNSTFKSIKY